MYRKYSSQSMVYGRTPPTEWNLLKTGLPAALYLERCVLQVVQDQEIQKILQYICRVALELCTGFA